MNDYIANPGESFTFSGQPKNAGYWQIGGVLGLRVAMRKRPPWLHRYLSLKLLGWEWFDGDIFGVPSQGKE